MLTYKDTNFMSTLLIQVYMALNHLEIRLTEWFNQTLMQMLCKFVHGTGTYWNQWLPYLLFAYREVPWASTEFSPFGHELRGPWPYCGRPGWENSGMGRLFHVLCNKGREKLKNMAE